MDLEKAKEYEKSYFSQVFGRLPLLFTHGVGEYLISCDGQKYLDMYAGVAVSSIGHSHPQLINAITEQSKKLIHTSNWVYNEPQLNLAKKLTELTNLETIFFTNDGTTAVETAIKLARKHTGKEKIISFEHGFHGRTMGSLSATWNPKYRQTFKPLVPGFEFAKYNDIESLKAKLDSNTASVIIEPVQGEAGALVPYPGYLKEVRELTEEKGVLMIADEIQTGFGRTGKWFGVNHEKVKPDIMTLAKGMGGGFPIGAVAYTGLDFDRGEHGGTFNGGPLACHVSQTVLEVMEKEKLVENAFKMGEIFKNGLSEYNPHGLGLMLGIDVDDAPKIVHKLIENNIIAIYTSNILRLLPPLTIKKEQVNHFIDIFKKIYDGTKKIK